MELDLDALQLLETEEGLEFDDNPCTITCLDTCKYTCEITK